MNEIMSTTLSRDVAPEFRRLLKKLPICALEKMKCNLEVKGSRDISVKRAIFDISVEILRRKWS